MKLIDVKAVDIELPENFAVNLEWGNYSQLLTKHATKAKKLKLVIHIYDADEKIESAELVMKP